MQHGRTILNGYSKCVVPRTKRLCFSSLIRKSWGSRSSRTSTTSSIRVRYLICGLLKTWKRSLLIFDHSPRKLVCMIPEMCFSNILFIWCDPTSISCWHSLQSVRSSVIGVGSFPPSSTAARLIGSIGGQTRHSIVSPLRNLEHKNTLGLERTSPNSPRYQLKYTPSWKTSVINSLMSWGEGITSPQRVTWSYWSYTLRWWRPNRTSYPWRSGSIR